MKGEKRMKDRKAARMYDVMLAIAVISLMVCAVYVALPAQIMAHF